MPGAPCAVLRAPDAASPPSDRTGQFQGNLTRLLPPPAFVNRRPRRYRRVQLDDQGRGLTSGVRPRLPNWLSRYPATGMAPVRRTFQSYDCRSCLSSRPLASRMSRPFRDKKNCSVSAWTSRRRSLWRPLEQSSADLSAGCARDGFL